jgi:beta-N-acetylhexosaminidase
MSARAFIAGCAGLELAVEEQAFFREAEPWGLILFRRNVSDPEQVRRLTAAFRDCVGRTDAPVLIDQEGGRVQRLVPPHWPRYPAGRAYGLASPKDPSRRRALAWLGARLIAADLRSVGVTVDCLPVLDVPAPGSHSIIGDRAYGDEPALVAELGRAAAEGLMAGGVLPVVKHIPGHGRANLDSHEALPRVGASLAELRRRDFPPFRALADMPLAMTAHIVFEAIDPERPATTSPTVIAEIIRGEIGFNGLLMSDDVSMKALSGDFRARAEASFQAGCDIALHCNGKMDEMRAVAEVAPVLAGEALRRAEAALARIAREPDPFDAVEARAELDAALALVA